MNDNEDTPPKSHRILIVDDDEIAIEPLALAVEDEFETRCVNSGAACLAAIPEFKPDVILLDINMPGIDGYETCRRLRDLGADVEQPAVIFVSACEALEERLQAYESGGDDYVVKPALPAEILRKARVAAQRLTQQKNLREQLAMSEQLSSIALASMDESGLVLQFMSKLIGWEHEREIAEGLLDLMKRYGLSGAVQTRVAGRRFTLGANGENQPLEVSVLTHVSSMGTIFEFRNRGVYNYENATLMVSNMPLDDTYLCGRIRDNLATAAAGASSRLAAIASQEAVGDSLAGIEGTLAAVREFHLSTRARTSELVFELDERLAKAFVNLGLSNSQEERLEMLIKEFMERLTAIIQQGDGIQDSLQSLTDRLHGLKAR
jgi:DNA-binding response OmpR family regulator